MRNRISNPVKEMKKLGLDLNCMFKVTQQARSEAGLKPELKRSHYTSLIRYRQFYGPVVGMVIRHWPVGAGSRE